MTMADARPRAVGVLAPALRLKRLARSRGLLIAIAVFLALLATVASIGSVRLSYYDLSQIATSGATLALAAIGQTIVILSGGFDLSAGAAISLVNVALASSLQDPSVSPLLIIAAGVAIGMASGAFNGFFVALLGMQPIVVTLATMFILQGVTLLIMEKPGGQVSPALSDLLMGDAIPNVLPKPILLIILVLLAWAWLKRTNFGVAIYAVGGDIDSARAVGVPTRLVLFMVYVLAGGCYGLSGVFISPPKDANGNSTSSLELNQFSWSAGLNLDWKMGGADPMRAYWFIRTRLTISSPFPQPDRRFAGNIVTFTVDVGFFGRSLMRDF